MQSVLSVRSGWTVTHGTNTVGLVRLGAQLAAKTRAKVVKMNAFFIVDMGLKSEKISRV
jgi:hypothetical protein